MLHRSDWLRRWKHERLAWSRNVRLVRRGLSPHVMALVCAMDDTEPDLGFAVLLLILIWGGFIAFCLHMGGAW